MITITKEGSKEYPNIRVFDGTKSFLIIRHDAPDTFWIPDYDRINDIDDIKFIIEEKNDGVYCLFNKLYQDIITGNVFDLENECVSKSKDETKRLKQENDERMKHWQVLAISTGLVKDGIILWHSDDYDPFETAAVLKIEKYENKIEITFSKSKENEDFPINRPTYAIRICENGSRYRYFHCPFTRLHCQLQAMEPDKSTSVNIEDGEHKKLMLTK